MKIKFMGGAKTVTGSCFIVETKGRRFAVDCGMHQGNAEVERRNWDIESYDPEKIEFVLLTHAHIDHSGLLPRLVKYGFHGAIYSTAPTIALLKLLLLDSAHIQEMEAQWKNKKHLRFGETQVKPLYTAKEAEATIPLFREVSYEQILTPLPGLEVKFRDAGHILGASMIELWDKQNGYPLKLVFSGDIGRPAQLMVQEPSVIEEADYLFMEATYGDRDHKNEGDSLQELEEAITFSYRRGEKVIIPAFAVERTQEIIYSLYLLFKNGRFPKDMPIYVDSPLAVEATKVFMEHVDYLDEETQEILKDGKHPLDFPQLHFSQTTQESMALNTLAGPAVIISASGMANAGRIKHHLRHNLWRDGASIVFVGFQAQGTLGRKIIDGAQKVHIFNEDIVVKAKVYTINSFSAHAGQGQLLDWLSHFRTKNMQVFLIHGEFKNQQILAGMIREKFGFAVSIPEYLEEITLRAGQKLKVVEYPEKATPRIDWNYVIGDMEAKLVQIRERKTRLEKKPWLEQTELRDRLLEINRHIAEIVSEV
jgi:metallo-beta-lactamase family protein